MSDSENAIDELIRRAIGDGASLPNAGKRLELDDPYTPDELQLAHKILKDNDLTPSWITESRELDDTREALLAKVTIAVRSQNMPAALDAEISAFNKRVLSFNLKAPQGITHKRMVVLERERRRITGG